jgi:predicted Zn-ribbon and HTH transcriptional regulator
MIKIYIGGVGSGKTLYSVREIIKNLGGFKNYSNIKIKNNDVKTEFLTNEHFFKNFEYDKNGDLIKSKLKLNIEFWQNIKDDINVVLDEAHTLFNARRSMTKINILLTNWVALIRKLLGTNPNSEGDLILITQLWYRLDNITRDMAKQVKYFVRHNKKECEKCGLIWAETSDDYEQLKYCPKCENNKLKKYDFLIEVFVFNSIKNFILFNDFGEKTYFKRYVVTEIEKYFKYYDTLQWDNLIEDL